MKKLAFLLFLIYLFSCHSTKKGTPSTSQNQAEVAFTISEKDFIPEGLAYDPAGKNFYVGSGHKRKILRIEMDGTVSDFLPAGQAGLGFVVGMKVDAQRRHLWFCSNTAEQDPQGTSGIFQYDLATGKLLKKYTLEGKGVVHFFNDVVVLPDGRVFFTDTAHNAIYSVEPTATEPKLLVRSDTLRFVNGITLSPDGTHLFVSGSGNFVKVHPVDGKLTLVPFPPYYVVGIDGLYTWQNSFVAIQNVTFPASINRYFLDEKGTQIQRGAVLLAEHPNFNIPTTGAIVDDWFYFIANAQLNNLENGQVVKPEELKEISIMRLRL